MSNIASGVRSAEWYRSIYRDMSIGGIVAAATAGVSNAIVCPTAHTLFIQKITFFSKTAAAQTVSFQDDSATVLALLLENSITAGVFRTIDYGAKGLPLTAGENLDIVNTAGPAYSYVVEGYARQTSATASTTIARTF